MYRNFTFIALVFALIEFFGCSTAEKVKSTTRGVASGVDTIDSAAQDLENTESTVKRIKQRFDRR